MILTEREMLVAKAAAYEGIRRGIHVAARIPFDADPETVGKVVDRVVMEVGEANERGDLQFMVESFERARGRS